MLALKFRPKIFPDLVGQNHISTILSRIVRRVKEDEIELPRSMIFTGTRGCGKTTTGRILGSALNCLEPLDELYTPCGKCAVCKHIAAANSPTVLEIDSATNGGVDNVNSVLSMLKYKQADKTQVVIWDEAHCQTPDSLILTDKGFTKIVAHQGTENGTAAGQIFHWTNREYKGRLYSIHTQLGSLGEFTGNHPIKVKRAGKVEWVMADEVKKTDLVRIPKKYFFKAPDNVMYDNGSHHCIKLARFTEAPLRAHIFTISTFMKLVAYYVKAGRIDGLRIIFAIDKHEEADFIKILQDTKLPLKSKIEKEETTIFTVESAQMVMNLIKHIGDFNRRLPGWFISHPDRGAFLDRVNTDGVYILHDKAVAVTVAIMLIQEGQNYRVEKQQRSYILKPINEALPKDKYYIYLPIDKITKSKQKKIKVYNLETASKTYYAPFEVHNSISTKGFDTLLKTLEEGQKGVLSLFLTTEPAKIPITIESRSLIFNFHQITEDDISSRLEYILNTEEIPYDNEVIPLLATEAHGSMRDAIKFADQINLGFGHITMDGFTQVFGEDTTNLYAELINALYTFDMANADVVITKLISRVAEPAILIDKWVDFELKILKGEMVDALLNRPIEEDILMRLEILWFLLDKVRALNVSTKTLLRLTCAIISARLTKKILTTDEAFALLGS